MILLHHDGSQERRDEYDGEQTRDGVGIPVKIPAWQHIAHQRQDEGEHHRYRRSREDGVCHGIDDHLPDQRFPLALLLGRGAAHRKMVQDVDEFARQMLLHQLIGRLRQSDHVRGEEGGDD